MKPILFATPRSGSTIIGELIGNLAQQLWDSKGFLGEFFNINPTLVTEAKVINGRLYLQRNQYVEKNWCNDPYKEKLIRKGLVDNDPNYVIKFLVSQIENWTVPWVTHCNFTPIFIERRNKVKQLVSYLASTQTNNWYFHKSRQYDPLEQISYNEETAIRLLWNLRELKNLKCRFKNPITIYYEDWLEQGGNQKALVNLLGITEPYVETQTDCGNTPYLIDSEQLLERDPKWLEAKDRITKLLNEI